MYQLPLASLLAFLPIGAEPAAAPADAPATKTAADVTAVEYEDLQVSSTACACEQSCTGGTITFASDKAFDRFIGPVSNPILSKDPRSLTEARALFVQNWIPQGNAALPDGDFQVYALQLRLALTERLSFIADKDGYAVIDPGNGDQQDGWLNVAAGLKYQLIRDEENQFLLTTGFMYEFQTGEAQAFSAHGDGIVTLFATAGKEFNCNTHVLATTGVSIATDDQENSDLFYLSAHIDHRIAGWIYPLAELNWIHYTEGGDRGIPLGVGEGDGLLNLGTSSVGGTDFLSAAIGVKGKLSNNMEVGVVWERPITTREDLMKNRIVAELIIRY